MLKWRSLRESICTWDFDLSVSGERDLEAVLIRFIGETICFNNNLTVTWDKHREREREKITVSKNGTFELLIDF